MMASLLLSYPAAVRTRRAGRCELALRIGTLSNASWNLYPRINSRTQLSAEHFRRATQTVVPITTTGRATVAALAKNRPLIHAIRREESARGRHPPE
jgi:hypothetical protein